MQIHNLDFHYHAGQERQPNTTLADYFAHAIDTGRCVVAFTDHTEAYLGAKKSRPDAPYRPGLEGLADYRADVARLASKHPNLRALFAPELHANLDLSAVPGELAKLADFFLCALPGVDDAPADNTAARLAHAEAMACFAERMARPVLLVHPFRSGVNYHLIKRPVPDWVRDLPVRPVGEYDEAELNRLFRFDIRAVARACRTLNLPVEINGETHLRIRGVNLPAPLRMLWSAYRLMQDEDVSFAPGSDLHGIAESWGRQGVGVPSDAFDALGVGVGDIDLLDRLGR